MEKDEKHCVNPQNASHNLDSKLTNQSEPPPRDVVEADFAAEAHGFTAYENTGQGSSYQGGGIGPEPDEGAAASGAAKSSLLAGLLTRVRHRVLRVRNDLKRLFDKSGH